MNNFNAMKIKENSISHTIFSSLNARAAFNVTTIFRTTHNERGVASRAIKSDFILFYTVSFLQPVWKCLRCRISLFFDDDEHFVIWFYMDAVYYIAPIDLNELSLRFSLRFALCAFFSLFSSCTRWTSTWFAFRSLKVPCPTFNIKKYQVFLLFPSARTRPTDRSVDDYEWF